MDGIDRTAFTAGPADDAATGQAVVAETGDAPPRRIDRRAQRTAGTGSAASAAEGAAVRRTAGREIGLRITAVAADQQARRTGGDTVAAARAGDGEVRFRNGPGRPQAAAVDAGKSEKSTTGRIHDDTRIHLMQRILASPAAGKQARRQPITPRFYLQIGRETSTTNPLKSVLCKNICPSGTTSPATPNGRPANPEYP